MPAAGGAAAVVIERGIRGELVAGLQEAPKNAEKIARAVTSDKRIERFFVGGTTAQMREFRDERRPISMFESFVDLENKHFEASIRIHRDDIEDAQVPWFTRAIRDLAIRAANFEDVRVLGTATDAAEVTTSEFGTTYLGGALVSTSLIFPDEAEFKTAQVNSFSVAAAVGTLPNIDELKEGARVARSALLGFKDDHGQPWHVSMPQRLVALVPPDLMQVAMELNQSSTVPAGPLTGTSNAAIGNVHQGLYDIVVNQHTVNADRVDFIVPGSDGRNSWPYVMARRLQPRLQQVTGNRGGEVSDNSFNELFDLYGVDMRHGVKFEQPFNIVRITFT